MKGGPFGGIQKALKQSQCAEKNPSEKNIKGAGILCYRGSGLLDVDVFVSDEVWRFEYVLEVRSQSWWCWRNEQKSGPIALNWRKKTSHCKSRDFLRERRLKTLLRFGILCRYTTVIFSESIAPTNDVNCLLTLILYIFGRFSRRLFL